MNCFKSLVYLLLVSCMVLSLMRWYFGAGENFDRASIAIQDELDIGKRQLNALYQMESLFLRYLDADNPALEKATAFQKAITTKRTSPTSMCLRERNGGKPAFELSQNSHEFKELPNGVVSHVRSGLIWRMCPIGMHYKDGECISSSNIRVIDPFTASMIVNKTSFAGYSDWRVPALHELAIIFQPRCEGAYVTEHIYPNAKSQDASHALLYSSHAERKRTEFAVTFGSDSAKTGITDFKGQLFLVRGGSGL